MGLFVKVLGAMVAADAIDRSACRPPRYWYPNQPGLPCTGTRRPYALTTTAAAAPPGWYGDPAGQPCWRWWDGQQWSAHTHPR